MDSSTQIAEATIENQMFSRLTALKVPSKVASPVMPYRSRMTLSVMNSCVIAALIC